MARIGRRVTTTRPSRRGPWSQIGTVFSLDFIGKRVFIVRRNLGPGADLERTVRIAGVEDK